MPTAEEPKQNVRGISVGIFYVLNYLMESRKEMTIPVSNDIIPVSYTHLDVYKRQP